MRLPNPGSAEAAARGCTCPIIDNEYGRGYRGQKGQFIKHDDCPLHGFGPEPHSHPFTHNANTLPGED